MFNNIKYLENLKTKIIEAKNEIERAEHIIKTCYEKIENNSRKITNYEQWKAENDLINKLKNDIYNYECQLEESENRPVYMCYYCGSDRYPYELIKRKSEKILWVREMDFRTISDDGTCGEYKSNPKNEIEELRLHKNSKWYKVHTNCCPFGFVKKPTAYMDPCF